MRLGYEDAMQREEVVWRCEGERWVRVRMGRYSPEVVRWPFLSIALATALDSASLPSPLF
jgi:hypothetical protein